MERLPKRATPRKRFSCYASFYRNSAYRQFPQEHRNGGTLGMRLIRVDEEPIDMIDPPISDVVIMLCHNPQSEVGIDVGDGMITHRAMTENYISVAPQDTEIRFRVRDRHHLTCVALNHETISALMAQHEISPGAWHALVAHPKPDRVSARIISSIWSLSDANRSTNSLEIDGLTLQLLSRICGYEGSPSTKNQANDSRIARAIEYLEDNLGESISLVELADFLDVSAGHISRCFRSATGETVWSYVKRRRCERAVELLVHSDLTIAQIAYKTGFSNQPHLTSCLRKQIGRTPKEIRDARL